MRSGGTAEAEPCVQGGQPYGKLLIRLWARWGEEVYVNQLIKWNEARCAQELKRAQPKPGWIGRQDGRVRFMVCW